MLVYMGLIESYSGRSKWNKLYKKFTGCLTSSTSCSTHINNAQTVAASKGFAAIWHCRWFIKWLGSRGSYHCHEEKIVLKVVVSEWNVHVLIRRNHYIKRHHKRNLTTHILEIFCCLRV